MGAAHHHSQQSAAGAVSMHVDLGDEVQILVGSLNLVWHNELALRQLEDLRTEMWVQNTPCL